MLAVLLALIVVAHVAVTQSIRRSESAVLECVRREQQPDLPVAISSSEHFDLEASVSVDLSHSKLIHKIILVKYACV